MKWNLFLFLCLAVIGMQACTDSEVPASTTPTENPDPDDPGAPDPEPDVFVKYYVATDGDDYGPGTIDKPFKTINHAMRNVNPGDTVLVREGSYHEFVAPPKSGEVGKVITLMSYPGETAKINGTGLYISGWKNGLITLNGTRHMTFEGLHICNASNSEPNSDPEGIFINGAARSITIKNCKIYEIKSVTETKDDNDWRSAHAILVSGADDINSPPIRDIVIEGCEIYECHTGTAETLTIMGNVDGFTIRNCVLRDVENIGIIAAGGVSSDPSNTPYARNGLIENNVVYNCSHTKTPFWKNNYGYDTYGAIGIYICGAGEITVERNWVYGCDRGIGLVSESNVFKTKNCIVRNNFVYNNYRTGIYLGDYIGFTNGGTYDCYVLNNTLFNNNSVIGAMDEVDGEGELRLTQNCFRNVIRNNVVYARPENDVFFRKYTQSGEGNVIENNHYYSKGNPKWIWNDVEYTDFAAWQSACGGDANSVFGENPLLVSDDLLTPDLHLQAESPARGTGEMLVPYFIGRLDIDGDPRTSGGRVNKGADQ